MVGLRRRGGLVLVAATVLGMSGCTSDDPVADPTPSEETSPEASPTEPTEPTEATESAPPEVVTTPVDLELPRTFVYANVEITVHEVVLSTATLGTFLDDEPEAGDATHAYVTLTAENEFADRQDRLDIEMLDLELSDGTVVDAVAPDSIGTLFTEAGTAGEWTVAFPVEDAAALEDATLVVAETGRVPATLPLTGEVPDDPYPVALEVTGSGTVDYEGGCDAATGTFDVVGAEVDVDTGVDHTGDAMEPNESKRAREGERWLRVTVQAVAEAGTCGGTIVNDSAFRLLIDDLPTAPLNRAGELFDNGAGGEFTWGWTVPVDATLVLQVGLPDGVTVDVPIELPADLP